MFRGVIAGLMALLLAGCAKSTTEQIPPDLFTYLQQDSVISQNTGLGALRQAGYRPYETGSQGEQHWVAYGLCLPDSSIEKCQEFKATEEQPKVILFTKEAPKTQATFTGEFRLMYFPGNAWDGMFERMFCHPTELIASTSIDPDVVASFSELGKHFTSMDGQTNTAEFKGRMWRCDIRPVESVV